MKRKVITVTAIVVLAFITNGCSVFMAARKSGTSIEEAQQCRTRGCLIAKEGVTVIDSKENEEGELIYEDYRIEKKRGSTARAVMHGILDVATYGIWEVAGTPIEGAKGKKKTVAIRVYYDKNKNIEKVEILQ